MIMNCDKTGISFDADSKRQKNHPMISALLAEASKDKYNTGTYRIAIEACGEIKAAGIQDINDAIAFIRERMNGNTNAKLNQRAVADRERKAQREERERTNALLRQHGYRWRREDEGSMDVFGANAFESVYGTGASVAWTLHQPDGSEVSVAQALKEIEAK